uniref:FBA_2 domain-containing protein n=1 Tax=Caenorhabditis tropicalis TaxID=1561998 RepID=A0A1I7TUJ6_9PELO
MKWYESIKGVLGCRIDKVCILSPSISFTDWLRSQQESIEDVSIMEGHKKDVKYFLETIKVFGELEIKMNPYESNFSLEIPEGPTHLHIHTSEFINYDQLLRLKAQFIYLDESFLTNQEINRFLESWMSCESHLDLKFFKINIYGMEAVNKIMNLPHEVITDGYKIRRCDGKEATVRIFWRSMRLLTH